MVETFFGNLLQKRVTRRQLIDSIPVVGALRNIAEHGMNPQQWSPEANASTAAIVLPILAACGIDTSPSKDPESSYCKGMTRKDRKVTGRLPAYLEDGSELQVTVGESDVRFEGTENEQIVPQGIGFYSSKPFSINGIEALMQLGKGVPEEIHMKYYIYFDIAPNSTMVFQVESKDKVYIHDLEVSWEEANVHPICYRFNDIEIPADPIPENGIGD